MEINQFKWLQEKIDKGKTKLENFPISKNSLLNLKIKIANDILNSCEFCERKCKINRLKGEIGYCKAGIDLSISAIHPHFGEEICISPSLTIFLSRCNWKCVYCQNFEISHGKDFGIIISPSELASKIDAFRAEGIRNVNFVGGEPTLYIHKILETLNKVKMNIPVIWNSNGYCSKKTMELLNGIVDLYLFDFRYFNDECAIRLSSALPGCIEILKRNHLIAIKQAESLIRILVLPNHIECCTKPMLEWISKNLGKKVLINLMDQYYPIFKTKAFPEINKRLAPEEFNAVVCYAKDLGLNFVT